MARISIYPLDAVISRQDKVIGTDSNNSITKNFPLQGLGNFFSSENTVLGQASYRFADVRGNGNLTGPADGTPFSSLTSFEVSEIDLAGHNIEDFLLEYAGVQIIIAQIDNKNNYGIFKVNSVTEDILNLNYYDFSLEFVSGNESLILDKHYLIGFKPEVGDKHYTHTQGSASVTWNVAHNLNKFPSVTVVLSTGQKGYADVSYTDANNLTITFTGAETGKAYMN